MNSKRDGILLIHETLLSILDRRGAGPNTTMSLHSIDPSNLDWTTLLVTLGAGLAAATYFHRCVYRGVPPALPPPGGLQTKGTVQLERGDVGGEEEVSPSERQSARETVRICTAEPA